MSNKTGRPFSQSGRCWRSVCPGITAPPSSPLRSCAPAQCQDGHTSIPKARTTGVRTISTTSISPPPSSDAHRIFSSFLPIHFSLSPPHPGCRVHRLQSFSVPLACLPVRQNHFAAPPNYLSACRDVHQHGTAQPTITTPSITNLETSIHTPSAHTRTHTHTHPPLPALLINRPAPAYPYRWALAFIERRIPIANHHCHQHFGFAILGAHEKDSLWFPRYQTPKNQHPLCWA